MTLGRKLFLLMGGLLALLALAQWLLYRSLARDVESDVRKVAFRVGEEIVSGFEFRVDDAEAAESATPGAAPRKPRVLVFATGERSGPGEGEQLPGSEAAPAEAGELPENGIVQRREIVWRSADGTERRTETFEKRVAPGGDRPFVIGVDENRDHLFLRGPTVERAIPIPRAPVASTLERFRSQLLLGNLLLFAVGLVAAAWLAHRMTRPLSALAAAAERVGEGELGVVVAGGDGGPHDEIGRAVASFNRMSSHLVELDRENRRLAEAEQLSELGDVARGLAHSLRNPLNALGLSIERLGARAADPDAAGELVDGSRRQIRRIDGALRSFLALASAGSLEAEPVDLGALAREVALEALQDSAGGLRIEVDGAAGERVEIVGVAAELRAILQALVVNASEAARVTSGDPRDDAAPAQREEGGDARASVSIRVQGDSSTGEPVVRIEIEDDGPGIPENVRARLFQPHVTTKPHGSGMGLFLAHRLATTRYRGALRLEPRAGGGALRGALRGTRAVLELRDRVAPEERA